MIGTTQPGDVTTASKAAAADARWLAHPAIGVEGHERLCSGGPVVIAGVGNVGARVAVALGGAGVPTTLVDAGKVEPENVGVQPFAPDEVGMDKVSACGRHIRRLRPGAAVRVWATPIEQLGPARLAGTRLVICATDSFRSRLWVAEAATCVGVPVLDVALDGTGESLFARIALYDPAHGTACLACGWDEANWQAVQEEKSASGCAVLLGTGGDPAPTLALPGLAEAVAGIAVVQAVRLLLGAETERVSGCEWRLNLTAGRLNVSRPRRDPRCRLDHERWPVRMLPKPPTALRLDELFAVASESVGEPVRLRVFGTAFVGAAACPRCRQEFRVGRLERASPRCPQCGGTLVPLARASAASFARTDAAAFVEKSLEEIGVHPGDLVMASSPDGLVAFGFANAPDVCL